MRAYWWAMLSALIFFDGGCYLCLTGSLVPLSHVDKLAASHSVTRLEADGIVLTDGKTVMPPGIDTLPIGDDTLADTVQRGIEIEPISGNMFVLVDVNHWCGNDPVREDLTRVNLSELIAFLSPRSVKAGILTEKAIKRLELHSAMMREWSVREASKPRLDPGDLLELRYVHALFQTPGVEPPDPYAANAERDGRPAPEPHPAAPWSRASNWP